ncbi:hypothetical protein CC78DRAFT_529438 [Lojkania enalia]|uniref:Uncharacterized protein n=1 Tax=Lojkania enalia TaxID=147567 RepID=A0A9P4N9R1_9PLEO|nr:hypothetical protein CC78DRAFT_529438 [Didymosphaeria enalia]
MALYSIPIRHTPSPEGEAGGHHVEENNRLPSIRDLELPGFPLPDRRFSTSSQASSGYTSFTSPSPFIASTDVNLVHRTIHNREQSRGVFEPYRKSKKGSQSRSASPMDLDKKQQLAAKAGKEHTARMNLNKGFRKLQNALIATDPTVNLTRLKRNNAFLKLKNDFGDVVGEKKGAQYKKIDTLERATAIVHDLRQRIQYQNHVIDQQEQTIEELQRTLGRTVKMEKADHDLIDHDTENRPWARYML